MKRLQSILCLLVLTLAISSTALAGAPVKGNIYTASVKGNIYTTSAKGNIYTASVKGNIYTASAKGNIYTMRTRLVESLFDFLTFVIY